VDISFLFMPINSNSDSFYLPLKNYLGYALRRSESILCKSQASNPMNVCLICFRYHRDCCSIVAGYCSANDEPSSIWIQILPRKILPRKTRRMLQTLHHTLRSSWMLQTLHHTLRSTSINFNFFS
jgi:hypothetical protein